MWADGRWRKYSYDEIIARDKTGLADQDNLPEPDELAGELVENLAAGLTSFREILAALWGDGRSHLRMLTHLGKRARL